MQKILFVEDHEEIKNIYSEAMRYQGFNVYTASQGQEGFELAKQIVPDAIILDVVMPKYDGFWMLENLKKEESLRMIPVFMFSNLNHKRDREQALKLGAVEYFVKTDITPGLLAQNLKTFFLSEQR